MNHQLDAPPVRPVLDRAIQLHRQMLVAGLFKYVKEVRDIKGGYAFRFRRSNLLTKRLVEYLLFEGKHSPQLTFMLVVEPNGGPLWLEVVGMEEDKELIRTTYSLLRPVGAGSASPLETARFRWDATAR